MARLLGGDTGKAIRPDVTLGNCGHSTEHGFSLVDLIEVMEHAGAYTHSPLYRGEPMLAAQRETDYARDTCPRRP
jgi:hypothetical protein